MIQHLHRSCLLFIVVTHEAYRVVGIYLYRKGLKKFAVDMNGISFVSSRIFLVEFSTLR
jgi:hypothetical protein